MATGSMADGKLAARERTQAEVSLPFAILKALGSLKITVAMFAMSMFIVFVGTLAQDDLDLAQVKREYFTCWIASIPFDVFFPTTLFEHPEPYAGGFGFYFPGGATIGLILLVNLIAAKTTRFKVFAKGKSLWIGGLISAFGIGLVTAVIFSGHIVDGLQGKPPISYDTLWLLLKGGCLVLTIALVAYAIMAKLPPLARTLVAVAAVCFFGVSALLMSGGESVRLDDPGLRIVWQLLQATIASSVLLAGLAIIFGRRGGNVLIHVGVGLLMVGQFVFGDRQIEQRIGLAEGAKTNLAVIGDEIEIALIDASDPKEDKVYAIPESMIRRMAGTDEVIDDPQLPCKLKILKWMQNSQLAESPPQEGNLATQGFGLVGEAIELAPLGAAIQDATNISAAYVQLLEKDSGEPIATLLLSQERNDASNLFTSLMSDKYEAIEIDGQPFEVGIRYHQIRKGYDILLKDVERINYSGTSTPRDYSSRIVITDRENGKSQEGKTWMNNPVRYQGETFYQSSYNSFDIDGKTIETTGLQVVKNAGWVIPYVSCMMVFVGMFAHFGGTFMTFSSRYARGGVAGSDLRAKLSGKMAGRVAIAITALAFCGIISGMFARSPTYLRDEVDWTVVGALPVQHEGRIKPFDTVARNVLQVISKPMFGLSPRIEDESGATRPPSAWLLGVMAGDDWVKDVKVFRIYAPEVRDLFDLAPRKGYRYSYNEMQPRREIFSAEVAKLRGKEPKDFDLLEERIAGMYQQLNLFDLIQYSYQLPPIPNPTELDTEAKQSAYLQSLFEVGKMMANFEESGPPSMIPPAGEATHKNLVDAQWQTIGPAAYASWMSRLGLVTAETSPALLPLDDVLTAVRDGKAPEINKAVAEYQTVIAGLPLAAVSLNKAATESWLNRFNPTLQGVAIYILAVCLGFSSFLVRLVTGWDGLRKATFWLLVGVFVIHTIALIARVYVSGRAPVINLYSSAVYIGWVCVLLALVLEWIYPIGVANLVAGLIGACTLSVARFLDTQDTLHVLQAVLDTQFWLSTHVITVTAGYAVTFLAGFIGICALVHRMATGLDSYPAASRPAQSVQMQQILYKMMYGTICFGIFFSFIGTVLGGLWADDSWGRFWGWDPKENGALMIVLWNALLLHARWDKQVGIRGFAILAVLGNIVTAWSWFGTNQLGIGLHSYGFTSGALVTLGVFIGLNLVFVVAALAITSAMSAGARRIQP